MRYLELTEQTRLALLRGYVERSWRAPGLTPDQAALAHARVTDPQAYDDGRRLRTVLDAVIAAGDFAALNVAERAYDDVAHALNARYGDGLVALTADGEQLGLRGFRGQGFATCSNVLVGEELVAS